MTYPWSHHQLISISSAIIHTSHDLGLIFNPYNCGEKMWNEVERETMGSQEKKRCHSETIEVPLVESCI